MSPKHCDFYMKIEFNWCSNLWLLLALLCHCQFLSSFLILSLNHISRVVLEVTKWNDECKFIFICIELKICKKKKCLSISKYGQILSIASTLSTVRSDTIKSFVAVLFILQCHFKTLCVILDTGLSYALGASKRALECQFMDVINTDSSLSLSCHFVHRSCETGVTCCTQRSNSSNASKAKKKLHFDT